jgi:hypothetical protein
MQVSEIAAAAAGDQNLLADSIGTFQNQHAPPALAGLNGAHQARRASSENEHIERVGHVRHM